MPTEGATHIDDLNPAKPAGAEDANLTDDYLRELKQVIQTDFPSVDAPVTPSPTEFNRLTSAVAGTVTELKAVIAGAGGIIDFISAVLTNVNIDSGTVDGTTVGANSASTGKFTTLESTANTKVKTASFAAENDESAGPDIDWTISNKAKVTPSGTTTITFTDPVGPTNLVLKVINGGAATVTWDTNILWPGGAAPDLTTAGTDLCTFYYDGTNYHGAFALDYS